MNINKFSRYIGAAAFLLAAQSCDKYLDVIPDNRIELNSVQKITSLLTSAYPTKYPVLMMECSSDNVMDIGSMYDVNNLIGEEAYLWKEIEASGNDDPRRIWQGQYDAISNANAALDKIEEMGNPAELSAQRGEALLCRAFGHFVLSTAFCKTYNPETADQELGVPYAMKPEKVVMVKYKRGTLKDLYRHINDDIEEGLPLISDEIYSVPKYHFNTKAAYAFAAWFNLLYIQKDQTNYKKAVEYATKALGNNPRAQLRNYLPYMSLGLVENQNRYPQITEVANYLILPIYSLAGRPVGRYHCSSELIFNELYLARGPWNKESKNKFLYYSNKIFGGDETGVIFPKLKEYKEEPGYARVLMTPFTSDKTLLIRAEANIHLKRYDEAMEDLNLWYKSHCYPEVKLYSKSALLPEFTREGLNEFFEKVKYSPIVSKEMNGTDRTIKKEIHPQGFTVENGEQENFIQCLLFFRRLETLYEGERWIDIKRYGIEVGHNRSFQEPIILQPGDDRTAFQLPVEVIGAGLEKNPRENSAN